MADDDLTRRVDTLERNLSDQAKSLSALIGEIRLLQEPVSQLRVDREVRKERDRNVHERFDRLEKAMQEGFDRIEEDVKSRFNAINKPLWAAALAFVTSVIAALTTWVTGGGMSPK